MDFNAFRSLAPVVGMLFLSYASQAKERIWDLNKASVFADQFGADNYIDIYTKEVYPTMSGTKIVSNYIENENLIKNAIAQAKDIPPEKRDQYGFLIDPENPSKTISYKTVANAVLNHQNNQLIKQDPDRVKKIKELLGKTKVYESAPEINIIKEATKVTFLRTELSDIVSHAEANKDKKVGVIVAADTDNMGGGYTDGAGAMEESIMYSMPYLGPVLGALVYGGGGKNNMYNIPETGAIVVDGIKPMRRSSLQKNVLIPEQDQFSLTAIFSAAPDIRKIEKAVKAEKDNEIKNSMAYLELPTPEERQNYYNNIIVEETAKRKKIYLASSDYKNSLHEKVQTHLNAADQAGVELLLYPAWGMGVFGNETADIVNTVKTAANNFKGNNLKYIQFVILPFEKDKFVVAIDKAINN